MDMLVNLRRLPDLYEEEKRMEGLGIRLINCFPADMLRAVDFVVKTFGKYAAGEARNCFGKMKSSLLLAVRGDEILGFACYDATAPDFFGPTAVLESERGKGIGKALLIRAMWELRNEGYAYAVIGDVGPAGFYEKTVGAVAIPGSDVSIYDDFVRG